MAFSCNDCYVLTGLAAAAAADDDDNDDDIMNDILIRQESNMK